ncbi:MAG: C45 family peptidase [Armatimonadota bacterium]
MSLATITLTGSPTQMGQQHGEELREAVQGMIQTRVDLAASAAARAHPRFSLQWCLNLAEESLLHLQRFSLPVYNELAGIAEGALLTMPEMVIGNGWTDFKDLLALRVHADQSEEEVNECTSVVVGGALTEDGHTYLAQTWDMNVSAGQYMLLVRREPDEGPRSLSFTTAGCLSLIGLNDAGIAIGNTNLAPIDARPGVFYLALIHQALAQRSFEEATEAITRAQRMSGHYYYLGGSYGEFMGIETTGTRHELVIPRLGTYVHTNHYLEPALLASGFATAAGPNTIGRQEGMERLAGDLSPGTEITQITRMLMDHDGLQPICRHCDRPEGAATLGAAVLCPQSRTIWVTAGNPCENPFESHSLA